MAMKTKQTTGKSCTQKRNDNNLKAWGVTRGWGKRDETIETIAAAAAAATTFYCCLTKNGDVGAGRDGFRSQRFCRNSASVAARMARIRIEQRESSIP